ncbi:MAG: ATP-binding protein [Candidatus Andersenbacteria bacterium]
MASIGSVVQPLFRLRLFASARVKLVGAFVAALAVLLVMFSGAIVGLSYRNLYGALSERLHTQATHFAEMVELRDGRLLFNQLERVNLEDDALRTLAVAMYGNDGELLWQGTRNPLSASPAVAQSLSSGQATFSDVVLPLERYRFLAQPVDRNGRQLGVIQVGLSLRDTDEALAKLLVALLLTVPGALLAAAVGGWFLAARALAPIEESVARQRQFVQDASHELRTPLAIIGSNIDVALSNPEPSVPQLQDKLRTVRETTKRMGKVIEDLFTLSTSDNQSLRLRPRLLDLDRAARDVVRQMRSLARTKHQQLVTGELEPLVVHADEDRLKQVLTIFVDNAIKYTPDGGTITVSVTKTLGIDYAKLSVQDTGPGIAREHQDKIFERFYRVDKSRSRALGGNGLGLPIAKMIVERSRGYVSVSSKPGAGSRFDVFLPLVAKKASAKGGGGFGLPRLFTFAPVRKTPAAPTTDAAKT